MASAQNTDLQNQANDSLYSFNSLHSDAFLFYGREYDNYQPGLKGDPFFINAAFENGDIMYNGVTFKDVPMLFDIVKQAVIINQYHTALPMQLLTEKVTWFTLKGHRFQILTQAAQQDFAGGGLYDIMYDGKASVLVKRTKRIIRPPKPEDPYYFKEENDYFIKNGQTLYSAGNKDKVLQAFEDKKSLISAFISKNKLKFKKNIEQDLVAAAGYYSSLN